MGKDGYFYTEESEMFEFFRIPKALIKEDYFKKLSLDAKFLYGLVLDRMGLSKKNGWVDIKGRVYIVYQIAKVMETMGVSRSKAINLLKELEEFGLVEKKRQGLNKPNLLYIKDFTVFITATSGSVKNDTSEEKTSEDPDVSEEEITPISASKIRKTADITVGSVKEDTSGCSKNDSSGSIENDISGGMENEPLEVSEMALINHTDMNKTDLSHTDSSHILSADANDKIGMTVREVRTLVQQNLDVNSLISEYPEDKELIEGIVNLITEILLIKEPQIRVAKKLQDAGFVRERLLGLTDSHIRYVIACLGKNAKKVGNMKQYLLATLFNAPLTMEAANKVTNGQKDVSVKAQSKTNRWINYQQSDHDFDELERLERELRNKNIATLMEKEESHATP